MAQFSNRTAGLWGVLLISFLVCSCAPLQLGVVGKPDDSALVVFRGVAHVQVGSLFGAQNVTPEVFAANLRSTAKQIVFSQNGGASIGDTKTSYLLFDNVKPGIYLATEFKFREMLAQTTHTFTVSPSLDQYRNLPSLALKVEPGKIYYIGTLDIQTAGKVPNIQVTGYTLVDEPGKEKAILTLVAADPTVANGPWGPKLKERLAALAP